MTQTDTFYYIDYDRGMVSDGDFVNDLHSALNSIMVCNQDDNQDDNNERIIMYSPSAHEWLEIAFVFASTTIATGFLAKIGEDILDKLKSSAMSANKRLRERKTKFKHQGLGSGKEMSLNITIKTDQFILSGDTDVESYEEIVQLLNKSSLMLKDAGKQLEGGVENIKHNQKYRSEENVVRSSRLFEYGLWFDYEYDKTLGRWELDQITDYKESEGGGFEEV